MTDDHQTLRWAGVVAVFGSGTRRGFEIDVHLPGHTEPEPMVLNLADARDLHAMLGAALADKNPEAGDDAPRNRLRIATDPDRP